MYAYSWPDSHLSLMCWSVFITIIGTLDGVDALNYASFVSHSHCHPGTINVYVCLLANPLELDFTHTSRRIRRRSV